jgi:hypothetical protein
MRDTIGHETMLGASLDNLASFEPEVAGSTQPEGCRPIGCACTIASKASAALL